jgi:octaprenyl-diphosphate synthase
MSSAQALLAKVEELVGADLQEVEQIFHTELKSWHPYVADVAAHSARFRGKRLRPTLLLLTAAAAGKLTHDHKVLGAVIEMIHTATLVHDDVLDESDIRRHVATVNARWNNETSILFGDYLFTHAFHLASELESTFACRLIGRATNLVCEGELAQIHERGNLDLTEETYFKIIEGKTAELCAVACQLGAHFACSDPNIVESLTEYGRCLGIAFQIADDLLDLQGSEEQTGKSLGTDLQKQKLTLPIIHLLQQASPEDAAQIRELLANPQPDTSAKLEEFFEQYDVLNYVLGRASEYTALARKQLECLPDSPARRILEEFTEFVTQRAF